MSCKNCNDCKDHGCAPTIYPKCLLIDKKYSCLGVNIGDNASKLFDALEAACMAGWGGGSGPTYTFNNGVTKTGNVVQLGGDLVKDTIINSPNGTYKYQFTAPVGTDTYVTGYDPNGGGPGVPVIALGVSSAANHSAVYAVKSGLFYSSGLRAQNGTVKTLVDAQSDYAAIRYSPDNGNTYRYVRVDANEVTIDGQLKRTRLNQTQLQENLVSIPSLATTLLTESANTFEITGSNPIAGLGDVSSIQLGTKITLVFMDSNPGLVQSNSFTGNPNYASLFLSNCVDWTPSIYDTISFVLQNIAGTLYWNEIGRKQCYPYAWKEITTLTNGWTNYGPPFQTAQYAVNGKTVKLRGTLVNPAFNPAFLDVISSLPIWPANWRTYSVNCVVSGNIYAVPASLILTGLGTLTIGGLNAVLGNDVTLSLEGIEFDTF